MSMLEWAKNEIAIASREKEAISRRVSGIMVVLAMTVLLELLRVC